MRDLNKLKEALEAQGRKAEVKTLNFQGREMTGIMIIPEGKGKATIPLFNEEYLEKFSKELTDEEVADLLYMEMIDSLDKVIQAKDAETPIYFMEHVIAMACCVTGNEKVLEPLVWEPVPNTDLGIYLILYEDGKLPLQVTKEVLKNSNVTKDLAWKSAMENTTYNARFINNDGFLYCSIVSGNNAPSGASALRRPEIFADLCKRMNAESLYLLPGHINDLRVLNGALNPEQVKMAAGIVFGNMPREERLSGSVYVYRNGRFSTLK